MVVTRGDSATEATAGTRSFRSTAPVRRAEEFFAFTPAMDTARPTTAQAAKVTAQSSTRGFRHHHRESPPLLG